MIVEGARARGREGARGPRALAARVWRRGSRRASPSSGSRPRRRTRGPRSRPSRRAPPARGQWYFQRYVAHLPTRGEIVLCDRSWYNRAGVERVMGFCSEYEYEEFLRQVPEFERNLVRSGVHLIKFWFSVSREEQRRRFKERKVHPLKQWQLSPIDLASLDKWDEYTRGR